MHTEPNQPITVQPAKFDLTYTRTNTTMSFFACFCNLILKKLLVQMGIVISTTVCGCYLLDYFS